MKLKEQLKTKNFRVQHSAFSVQKGISLLFAILIMSVVLTAGLGISIISTQQTKMMGEIGYSVIAFYAADNGVEEILITESPTSTDEITLNNAKYQVIVNTSTTDPNCEAPNYCIKSIGSYKETRRAIEITY